MKKIISDDRTLLTISLLFSIGIFIYDLYTPIGWSEWVLYLIPLILISFSSNSRFLIYLCAIDTIFIILDLTIAPPVKNLDISIFIRIIGIIFFWLLTNEFIKKKKAIEELKSSEVRYHSLFEKNPKALFVYDISSLKIIEANLIAKKRYGYTKEELFNMKITDLHEKDDRTRFEEFYRNESDDVISLFNCTHLNKFSDKFECDITSLRLRFGNQDARLVLVLDVTDIKLTQKVLENSLKEKEILLKEIHHRVKNNLQIVSSLLNIQSRKIKDPQALEYFKQSQSRVQVMSLIHEKLYKTEDLSLIDFGNYIRQLASNIYQTYNTGHGGVQFYFDITNIRLGIDAAIPCGLIINELITNSLKYAFPKGKGGNIRISLHNDEGEYKLVYNDDGIGMPNDFDITKTNSLGTKLISTLSDQLRGKLSIHSNHGTEFILNFPQ